MQRNMDHEVLSFRVLILAPIGRDASASADLLRKVGLMAHVAHDVTGLVAGLTSGAGAAFVAEEALFNEDLTPLKDWIAQQPPWSDFPFVVLTSRLDHPRTKIWRQTLADKLQNVSMLERPLQAITLTSAMQVALRARRRQYEIKALIEAQETAAEHLEAQVAARSAYRGRDDHCWSPPAQIRTRPTKASGSYLGCLTSKRSSGQG
jgi:hypothetical protein